MNDFISNANNLFLIAGLGNPGRQYDQNRHNIGFMVLDSLTEKLDLTFSRIESRALITKGFYKSKNLIIAKPQTYMNNSGQSLAGLVHFYKIELNHILIIHDDIDLPFGRIRLRPDGSSGGHKGMQSIIDKLGSQDLCRLRIGIGRPTGNKLAANYVLKRFSKNEIEELPFILDRSIKTLFCFLDEGVDQAMNQFNSKEI